MTADSLLCASCGQPLPTGASRCPACGRRADDAATVVSSSDTTLPKATVDAPPRESGDVAPAISGYKIVSKIGSGGMGSVWLAEEQALGRHVAIKVISVEYGDRDEVSARFNREARATAKLEHPHIVRIYSFGSIGEKAYLVMEFVEGEVLAERIRREGKLPVQEALRITRQVAQALEAAWEKKIVHRDIKPSNILFDKRGEVRVVDFGVAKPTEVAPDEVLTQDGTLLGTPHYLSPEQAKGEQLDFRSDLYSLGVVLYEMLTGERPFSGSTPYTIVARHLHEPLPPVQERRPDVDPEVERLVQWLTAKNREDRPASYKELIAAIDALVAPVPRLETRAAPSHPPVELLPRYAWSWVGMALLVAIPIGVVALFTLTRFPGASAPGIVLGVVAAVIAAAVSLSWWLTRVTVTTPRQLVRYGVPAATFVVAAAAYLVALNPGVVAPSAESASGLLFTYGGYPTRDRMQQLQAEGYSAVVSLLNPLIFPLETQLLIRERTIANRFGMKLIELPMTPWRSANASALEAFAKLAASQSGRYFVHGYLSGERTREARTAVQQTIQQMLHARAVAAVVKFERGQMLTLDDGIYLTPCPTADELKRFAEATGVRQVVSLLDQNQSDNAKLTSSEEEVLAPMNIAFRTFSTPLMDYDPSKVLEAVEFVRNAEKAVLVHSFFGFPSGRDAAAEAFLQAYRSAHPPLPPLLFTEPMRRGAVSVIAPHVATGPRPMPREFGAYLLRRGVRSFCYVGDAGSPVATEDQRIAKENKLEWRVIEPLHEDLLKLLERGGPYYLYGPALPGVTPSIKKRFGPAVPER